MDRLTAQRGNANNAYILQLVENHITPVISFALRAAGNWTGQINVWFAHAVSRFKRVKKSRADNTTTHSLPSARETPSPPYLPPRAGRHRWHLTSRISASRAF